MGKIRYRMATVEDIDICIKISTDAFFNYEFTKIYCTKSEEKRYRFYESTFKMIVPLAISHNRLFVMTDDDKVVALVQLKSPADKDYPLSEMFKFGLLNIIKTGGLFNTLGYVNLLDKTEVECNKIKDAWYVECFAVTPKVHRKGYGTRLIQEFLFDYVKSQNGKRIVLCTNSQSNYRFYLKNSFTLIKYEDMTFSGKHIGNWTFVKELE